MTAGRTYIQRSFTFLGDEGDAQKAGSDETSRQPDGVTLFGPPQPAMEDGQLSFLAPPPGNGSSAIAAADSAAGEPALAWDSLDDLALAVAGCTACRLRGGCTQVVFGEGDPRAMVMFVGEGPGETEDQLGRPFVGRAGQLLDRILTASGFERGEVYIANVVKCRPPGNRQPSPEEAEACLPWLRAQIRLIRPRLVVCLGAAATGILIDPRLRITSARGKWHERNGLRYMPTFHPAALLRDPSKKRAVWEDMKNVRAEYERLRGR
ncbi:MAG: uracil-DNA glycosylase [Bacillota bacterium]|nr:uracil-DNA glycosylase [Bacillota bacterium]